MYVLEYRAVSQIPVFERAPWSLRRKVSHIEHTFLKVVRLTDNLGSRFTNLLDRKDHAALCSLLPDLCLTRTYLKLVQVCGDSRKERALVGEESAAKTFMSDRWPASLLRSSDRTS